jgi:hypothetical protein
MQRASAVVDERIGFDDVRAKQTMAPHTRKRLVVPAGTRDSAACVPPDRQTARVAPA